ISLYPVGECGRGPVRSENPRFTWRTHGASGSVHVHKEKEPPRIGGNPEIRGDVVDERSNPGSKRQRREKEGSINTKLRPRMPARVIPITSLHSAPLEFKS